MHRTQREQEILSILKASGGFVSVHSLCDQLFASQSSIRRDLRDMEENGLIKRSYGGASAVSGGTGIVTFSHRTLRNAEAKGNIAKKAAALVHENAVVFMDQSSTAFYLALELQTRHDITVVTNNTEILMLMAQSGARVISSGGHLSLDNRNCLIGEDACRTFEKIYADIMFFSVYALSFNGAVCDCSAEETAVRNSMIKNAQKTVLLCDSSKFGQRATYRQCGLSDVDVLISEDDKSAQFKRLCAKTQLL